LDEGGIQLRTPLFWHIYSLFARSNSKNSKNILTMTSIKAIIFDFGGVLIDWSPHNLYQSYFPDHPQAIDEFLKEVDFYTWNAKQDQGRSFIEAVTELSEKFPHRRELIQAYADNWEDSITGEFKGTIEILYELKSKGYPLYGLSNWSAETFPLIKDDYPFFNKFDEIILSGEVGLIKPDPEIYHLLLSKISYTANECVFIDDSMANIDAAKDLGLQVLHFKSPEILRNNLEGFGLL